MAPSIYSDDNLILISALQHYVFCKRQFALIHLEQQWVENTLTAEGRLLHERVDHPMSESRRDLRIATAVRVTSLCLGIIGVMDMLELQKVDGTLNAQGVKTAAKLKGLSGYWKPFPVEYKRGRPKSHRADEIQLCAQALCLEEMLDLQIKAGALYYGSIRRRTDVEFDDDLRDLTHKVAEEAHAMIDSGITPSPFYGKWCESCSVQELCQPKVVGKNRSAHKWLQCEIEVMLE